MRIALGGVNDRPVLAAAAAARLEGEAWDDAAIEAAAQLRARGRRPARRRAGDAPSTARHLVPIHVRRVLTDLADGRST